MNIQQTHHTITCTRGNSPRVRKSGYTGSAEAAFWRTLRDKLNTALAPHAPHWRIVRPCQWALTGMPYALRLGANRSRNMMILDNDYMLRTPDETYNNGGEVRLSIQEVSDA